MTQNSGTRRGYSAIVVRDGRSRETFQGQLIGAVTMAPEEALKKGYVKWTDLILYRAHSSEPYAYYVQVVGRSLLYHRPEGPCHRGVRMQVSVLAQNEERYDLMEPCPVPGCKPADLDELEDADTVSVEVDFFSSGLCRTADDAVEYLYNRGGEGRRSGLSLRLLEAASVVDEDIAEAVAQAEAQWQWEDRR